MHSLLRQLLFVSIALMCLVLAACRGQVLVGREAPSAPAQPFVDAGADAGSSDRPENTSERSDEQRMDEQVGEEQMLDDEREADEGAHD